MSYSVGPKDVSLDGTGRPTERAPTIICPGALIRARSERSLWLRSRGRQPQPPILARRSRQLVPPARFQPEPSTISSAPPPRRVGASASPQSDRFCQYPGAAMRVAFLYWMKDQPDRIHGRAEARRLLAHDRSARVPGRAVRRQVGRPDHLGGRLARGGRARHRRRSVRTRGAARGIGRQAVGPSSPYLVQAPRWTSTAGP